MAPPRPASICEFCWEGLFAAHLGLLGQRLNLTDLSAVTGGYAYTTSWADLESGASRGGCRWCRLVLDTREYHDDADPDVRLDVVVGEAGPLRRSCTPENTQGLSVYVNGRHAFSAYVHTTADDNAAPYIVARSRILDVGSSRAVALARACIDECMHGHRDCGAVTVSADVPLPTRLIDCADPDHPRLASTAGTLGQYVALSYVWGGDQEHKTTQANIRAYAVQIDPSRLPLTIRDAVRVTHALGFGFLWVDSLCIIQDSREDMQRELGRMRRIYRDAALTIIASSAQRVSEGFLQDRPAVPEEADDSLPPDIVLPFVCPRDPAADPHSEQVLGTVHLCPVSTSNDPFGYTLLPYNPAREPISARGWCMQEFFMSTRALLYTSHALLYKCQTTTLSVGGAYYDTYYDRRLPDALFLPDPPLVVRGSKMWEDVRWAWLVAVQDYTRRAITVPSDKLVACGGIAEEFARILCSEYLAGLWRDMLPKDLLWRKGQRVRLSRPSAYRAPSWSWAAVDGEVFPGSPAFGDAGAEVVRCEVTLEDAALPFGRVTSASLVLRTALIPCVWTSEGESCFITLHLGQPARLAASGSDRSDKLGAVTTELTGTGSIDCKEDEGIGGGWVTPIRWDETEMEGLVVTACPDLTRSRRRADLGAYRRVGYFILRSTGELRGFDIRGWLSEQPLLEIELV